MFHLAVDVGCPLNNLSNILGCPAQVLVVPRDRQPKFWMQETGIVSVDTYEW